MGWMFDPLVILCIPIAIGAVILCPFLWEEIDEWRKRKVADPRAILNKVPESTYQTIRDSIWKDNSHENLRRLHEETGLSMAQLRQIRSETNPVDYP